MSPTAVFSQKLGAFAFQNRIHRIEPLDEARNADVARLRRRAPRQPPFHHQSILRRSTDPFDPTLRLARMGAQDLDPQVRQGPAELRHALPALRLRLRHLEHHVLVGIEGERPAEGLEIATQRLEVTAGALESHEAQLYQTTCRVVDEHRERAGRTAILEPAMLAAVDLHQLAEVPPSQPRLMHRAALPP